MKHNGYEFNVGDHVRIKSNVLSWQISSINVETKKAWLKSGNMGVGREVSLDDLRPWSMVRG